MPVTVWFDQDRRVTTSLGTTSPHLETTLRVLFARESTIAHRYACPWVAVVSRIGPEQMSNRTAKVTMASAPEVFVPRSALGSELIRLRRLAIDAGMELWDADKVLAEVKKNRGELYGEEEDLY